MARIALQQGLLPRRHFFISTIYPANQSAITLSQFDAELSGVWARQLKQSMNAAEHVRQQEENLRPMPYQIVPETWTRLRPSSLLLLATSLEDTGEDDGHDPFAAPTFNDDDSQRHQPEREKSRGNAVEASTAVSKGPPLSEPLPPQPCSAAGDDDNDTNAWSFVSIRPPMLLPHNHFDEDQRLVMELLYHRTPFYFSCGAKFGCDILLYDGPREERHAFAGLRIVSSTTSSLPQTNDDSNKNDDDGRHSFPWPIPSAYDMAGYVRCLNTAGKLALLATVVRDKSDSSTTTDKNSNQPQVPPCVAIVDLALEKVLTAPTHQRRARKNPRREAGQHLAKR
jgi:hypothetical protein